nr:hypothetical protein Iba_chr08cCG9840 [Ipomoea batatas]
MAHGRDAFGEVKRYLPSSKAKDNTKSFQPGTICGQYLDYAMPLLSLLFWTLGKILMLYQSVFRVKITC